MSLTCGYTYGDVNKPMTCGTNGLHCSNYASKDGNNFGCCGTPDTGCYMSACYDYQPGGLASEGFVLLGGDPGGAGFYCPSDIPYCQNWVLIGNPTNGVTSTFTSFGCDSTKNPIITLFQRAQGLSLTTSTSKPPVIAITTNPAQTSTTPGPSTGPTSTIAGPTSTGSSTTSSAATGSSTTGSTATGSTTTNLKSSELTNPATTAAPVSTPPPQSQTSASSSTSAASGNGSLGIGIGVGVGATIVLIAAVLLLLRYLRKKKEQSNVPLPLPKDDAAPPQYFPNEIKNRYEVEGTYVQPQHAYSELSDYRGIYEMPGPTAELPGR